MKFFDYSTLKIETGIDIPQPRTGPKGRRTAIVKILKGMKVGESILLESKNQYHYVRSIAKTLGVPITSRTNPEGTIRVWKVKK